jgi:hypothetical protein
LQGPYVGKTVCSAGFKGMAGIYLVYIKSLDLFACLLQGPYVGKTVRGAGFRGMAGIYLVYIDRYIGDDDFKPLHAVSPGTEIHVSAELMPAEIKE